MCAGLRMRIYFDIGLLCVQCQHHETDQQFYWKHDKNTYISFELYLSISRIHVIQMLYVKHKSFNPY